MNKIVLNFLILIVTVCLSSCTTTTTPPNPVKTADNLGIPNNEMRSNRVLADSDTSAAGHSMDVFDKEKLFHALDKAVGKSTKWTNESTNITYMVQPTHKLSIDGNPYCRKYSLTATKNDNTRESTGVACVSAEDGSWKIVN